METKTNDLVSVTTTDLYSVPMQMYYEIMQKNNLRFKFSAPSRASDLENPVFENIVFESQNSNSHDWLFTMNDCIASVSSNGGSYHVSAAGTTMEVAQATVKAILADIPETVPKDGRVPILFWSLGPHGPQSHLRKIEVPTWDVIENNYTAPVKDQLEQMMREFKPSHGGQLILWQGLPGTGKTWALRSLAQEWKDWATFHYITDPEVFFGEKAAYMLGVLLDEDDSPRYRGDDDTKEVESKWRVLILEDTGEILASDAKQKTGQALSRLLNVVDGLIGQGLKILVLVTTNEELGKLHPAVQRPGRCAARVEFKPLTREEVNKWLTGHGVDEELRSAMAVADLYGIMDGYTEKPRSNTNVGFAAV